MRSQENSHRHNRNCRWRYWLAPLLVLGLLLAPATSLWAADDTSSTADVTQATWLEPRGISVIDLVGLVPEEHLVDTIVTWHVGGGMLQYISGQRVGNTVTVNVKVFPRYWTDGTNSASIFNCLGKASLSDEWTVAVGHSTMRVFENGTDITSEAQGRMDNVPAGQILPGTGSGGWWRYDFLWGQTTTFTADGSVDVPANMGCKFYLPGIRTNLTAQFVVDTTSAIRVETLGSQSFIFHSYIGVGDAGHFGRLNGQMAGRFGNRHDKYGLTPPSGTEFVMVKYPPTPVDPYMGQPEINANQPSSGSYRFIGSGNTLSVDHVNSMAMPLAAQWQDADQSGGTYLKFFSNAGRVATPEYFVPAGVAYDPCMINGGCSSALLDQIYHTEMTLTVYYYKIGRIAEGLTRLPLKQVGPSWKPGALAATATTSQTAVNNAQASETVYLPYITVAPAPPPILEDTDRTGCPCGWFDNEGRMLDYVPAP